MKVQFKIIQDPLPAEDSVVTAKITHNMIGIEGSFDVTVTARTLPLNAPLQHDQQRALPDGLYRGILMVLWFYRVFLIRFYGW